MKILHLSTEKTWRGGEQQIAYLVEELNKMSLNQQMACRNSSAMEKFARKQGWITHRLPFKNTIDVYTAWGIKKICRQEKISIIHLHTARAHSLGFLSYLMGNATPMITTRRVDFPPKKNPFSGGKYRFKGLKRVICVSETIRKIVLPHVKHPSLCQTIYSGINLSRFNDKRSGKLRQEFSIPDNQLLIGNVAAIAPHKDYFTFVNTARQLKGSGVQAKYLIVGDGPLRGEIQAYVADQNLKEDIIFTGFRNDIPQIIPELDVFLFTSKTEGLGTSLLDAFACNVPVVATDAGGVSEIVIHEQTGLLAPVGNVAKLAYQVKRLIDDRNLRTHLIQEAARHVKLFDTCKMAIQYKQVYEQVIAGESQQSKL